MFFLRKEVMEMQDSGRGWSVFRVCSTGPVLRRCGSADKRKCFPRRLPVMFC